MNNQLLYLTEFHEWYIVVECEKEDCSNVIARRHELQHKALNLCRASGWTITLDNDRVLGQCPQHKE